MTLSIQALLDTSITTGRPPLGTFVTSIDSAVSVVLANAGFDFAILDCEHGPMDRVTALNHVRAAALHAMVTVIRSPDSASQMIQSYFDIGAAAVIVPKVENRETAERIARVSKYQPGGRGMCPGCDAARYSQVGWGDHVARSNQITTVIPLIETQEGINNLADIVAVEGIDIIMFGPGDLSQDMGLNLFDDFERLLEIWQRFQVTVRDAGKKVMAPFGLGFTGADIGTQDMDLMMIDNAARAIVAAHRGG